MQASERSRDDVSLMLHVSSCSTVLWLKYGLLNGDTTVVACNLTGMLLNGYYLGVFCMYTSDIVRTVAVCKPVAFDMRREHASHALFLASSPLQGALKQPAVMVAVYVYGVLIYCRYLTSDYGQAVESLGFASCLGTVAMFGSPLATVVSGALPTLCVCQTIPSGYCVAAGKHAASTLASTSLLTLLRFQCRCRKL